MVNLAYFIPLFPLASFVFLIFYGKRLGPKSAKVAIGASLAALVTSLPFVIGTLRGAVFQSQFEWLRLGGAPLRFGILIDPLSAMMLFVVTVVGTLIIIYSVGYMHEDPGFSRFFAYLSLFMFSMLTLVLADNLVLLYISWELVGLCSYFLIGFWFEKDSAAQASKKAFITTRIGDVGFFLGILLLYFTTGSVRLVDLNPEFLGTFAGQSQILTLAALLIFCGAIGKSAQFPLHVWLPDAMEGPTPVSALIHAATMVAAGVYLVARSFGMLVTFPDALPVVASIGTFTAFLAAFIALTQTDIKRVLAYSTISQLGFMIAALGLKGYSAGTFHLMTHAFFKALLFLGAGSVIHGTGTQDLREMGGLWKKMPHTTWTFVIASLAIAGVPPFSGFWSKDEILVAAFNAGNPIFYYTLTVTATMTAFYMFRLVFLTFFGKPRKELHVHESPAVMTTPLWLLALGSAVMGLPGSPWMHHAFQTFIEPHAHGVEHTANPLVMQISVACGGGGILLAGLIYLLFPALAPFFGRILKPLYLASSRKFWFDELYQATVIRAWYGLGGLLNRFDQSVIDGAVNGTGLNTLRLSDLKNWVDIHIVDGLVNGVGAVIRGFSSVLRRLQTGLVQNYMFVLFAGVLLILFFELNQ
ncbi:MAG: NADH-quinone oxidoreductase subunit L [Candidatus Omnitrophica bacterium]|nr:NADH-quinone oxidoreductase subunit L [Candidatus Omnitrophota bacterium]